MVCSTLAFGLVVVCAPRGAWAGATIVTPGQSIQDAVDAASAGGVVKVMPGTYTGKDGETAAVRITKSLKLIAKSDPANPVVIVPGTGNTDGIVVEPENPGDPNVVGVLINGFTVEGFENNGIWLKNVTKFKIKNNTSIDNLENGIWPTLSAKGLVKNNVAYGSLDSGLWVEASENVRIIKNELYENPTGLEVTISKKLYAKGNHVHDNTVGVGLYHPNGAGLVSPYPYEDLVGWRFIGNTIENNNFPNPVSGGLVGALPPGIGALLIGVDGVTMAKNTITGNSLIGLVVTQWCLFNDCMAVPPITDQFPDDNLIVKNTVTGNGAGSMDPDYVGLESDITLLAFGGENNCFFNNTTVLPGAPADGCYPMMP